jgi:hypothetical protein
MNYDSPIPRFFAVKRGPGYKLYENRVYKPSSSSFINIITNLNTITLISIGKYDKLISMNNSLLRKHYGGLDNKCSWTYTGYELTVNNTENDQIITLPLIHIQSNTSDILPSGSTLIELADRTEYKLPGPSAYSDVEVFNVDPFPTSARVIADVHAGLHSDADAGLHPEVTTGPLLPVHVRRILIADCIAKNECCPISSDDIDGTNSSVTSCGHVFTTDAITRWLTLSAKKECPVCKQACRI